MMKKSFTALSAAGTAGLILSACQPTTGEPLGTTIGQMQGEQGGVEVIDPRARGHLQADLTMADFMAFAEKVTNKMLTSSLFQSLGEERPKLILGDVVNNSDNENIRVADIHNRIQETIFNAGVVRVVDRSATDFDYVVKPELTSTRQYGQGGREMAFFTMTLKLFTLDGELVGQWSDDLALGRT